jgi:type I restriction enzyme, S subunit
MKKRVPKLRFPEFNGEWEPEKMGKAGTFRKGGKLSKADISTSGTPCILYGELYTTYEEIVSTVYLKTNVPKKELVFARPGDLLIPASGETEIDISTATCIVSEGIALGGDFNVYHSDKLDCRFLSYEINHIKKIDIAKLAQGKSIVHIKPESLSTIIIDYPQLTEQQRIADFLSTIDNIITSEQRILDDLQLKKKGLMQKLFSRELRFKDKDGKEFPEWEEKRLGEVCRIVGGGTPDTSIPEYWGGTIQWFTPTEVGHSKYIRKSARTISESGFNKSAARKLPAGTILLSSRATLGEMSIVQTECTTNQGFQSLIPCKQTMTEYIYYLQPLIKKYCFKYAYGSTFQEISNSNLAKCPIPFPRLEEQKKIADCLCLLDNVIEEQQKIVDGWKLRKKGLLQQMFV